MRRRISPFKWARSGSRRRPDFSRPSCTAPASIRAAAGAARRAIRGNRLPLRPVPVRLELLRGGDGAGPGEVFRLLRARLLTQERLAGGEARDEPAGGGQGPTPGGDSAISTPGLVTHYSVVLATTKGYADRIYLGRGIFPEPARSSGAGELMPSPVLPGLPDPRSAGVLPGGAAAPAGAAADRNNIVQAQKQGRRGGEDVT